MLKTIKVYLPLKPEGKQRMTRSVYTEMWLMEGLGDTKSIECMLVKGLINYDYVQ